MHRLLEPKTGDPTSLAAAAADIYGMRRARDRVLSSALVGEPAWDILLALYSEHSGKLSATSLANSFDAPASTVQRWVRALESEGLVHCQSACDPMFISLTAEGCRIMERCLKAMVGAAHG